jgi:ribonuclease Z
LPKLIFLGTSNAIPDLQHDNTHMAVVGETRMALIDCGTNPIVRFKQAGLDIHDLTDVLLTHFHPDHVAGVPSLLMNMWLLGRKAPLNIYGLSYTLERIKKMMEFYDWGSWPIFFPTLFVDLPEQALALALDSPEFRMISSPVCHIVPAIGLRIEFLKSGRILAYSCDTEPCEAVARLAAQADLLVHEATGAGVGHSSAREAGQIASQAQAKALALIHYKAGDEDPSPLVNEAKESFQGPVFLAQDFMSIEF